MDDLPSTGPDPAPGPSTSSTDPAPPRGDRLPVIIMGGLVLALVAVVTLGFVLAGRSCGDEGPGDAAPVRGIPVMGLSGAPTASPAPGDSGVDSPGPSPAASISISPVPVSPVPADAGVLPTPASPLADPLERPWAGTWLLVDDPGAGIVIEGGDGGFYRAHAPDGSNEVTLLPVGDDRLVAAFAVMEDGHTRKVRLILTIDTSGERITLEQSGSEKTQTWELRRAE